MFVLPDENDNKGSEPDSGYSYDYGENEDVNKSAVSDTDRELFSSAEPQFNANPNSGASSEQARKLSLIEEARKIMRRGSEKVPTRLGARLGFSKDAQKALRADTPENRARVKEEAQKKARKLAKDKIGKKIADKGVQAGFKRGISKGAKQASKDVMKQAGKTAVKAAGKTAVKGGSKVATGAAVEGGIAAAGAATGAVSFGLGFLLSILLDIAISLGINDAVDAGFELKDGNIKKATFLAIRAATKVGMFFWLLVTMLLMVSIGGILFGLPLLLLLNIYLILGKVFPSIPQLQGFVGWEIAIIIFMDFFAFIMVVVFLGALGWFLCGQGQVGDSVIGAIAAAYDWWNSTSGGSVAAEFCKFVNTGTSGTGGGDFGGGGAGGNF